VGSGATLTPELPGTTNPTGDSVSAVFGQYFRDIEGANVGIAVAGVTGAGNWQYSLNGQTWNNLGAVTTSAARLLTGNDLIRFVPQTNFHGGATISAYAWDQSSGSNGGTANLTTINSIFGLFLPPSSSPTGGSTAFSIGTLTATLEVNTAPTLTSSSGPTLANTAEGVPSTRVAVSALYTGAGGSDVDTGALRGVALVGTSGSGTWQYSLDRSNWFAVGNVSESLARLLPGSAFVRFVPVTNQIGLATLVYRAWDRTEGTVGSLFAVNSTGGATAISDQEAAVGLTVTLLNHAPTWSGSGASVLAVLAGSTNPSGATVAAVFGSHFNDRGGASVGVAVVGLTGGGQWQYSRDGGHTWFNFSTVNTNAARLLLGSDRIRFVPNATFTGTATIQANAWDQFTGNAGDTVNLATSGATGGNTAYSIGALTASCIVRKQAPTWTGTGVNLTPVLPNTSNPSGDTVATIFGSHFVDLDGANVGIAVAGLTGAANGTWQYSLNGGTTWINFNNVSTSAAQLLQGTDLIRFVPNAGFMGTVTLSAYAWNGITGVDGSTVNLTATATRGGTTAFSSGTLTASCTVNTAPTISPI
jgi:hypothetical protein